MAKIRGNTQILDSSINWEKLEGNFLDGADLDITNGNNDATITGVKDPVNNRDVATKQYVDALLQGIQGKFVARVRAQADVGTLSGAQSVDGVSLIDGDTILLDSQSTSTEDGLYIVRAGAWERATGWDTGDGAGAFFVFVEEGTDDNKGFVCTNDSGSDVIGTDDLVFAQFSGAGTIVAGTGMVQNGADFNIVSTDLSLSVHANDMQVNVGTTNGTSLSVSATGLELASVVTGARTFNTGAFSVSTGGANDLNLEAGGDLFFNDSEVGSATVTTKIPFAMTATIDYGNGNGTSAGSVIDQFRTDFTDDGIVNALCQLKAELGSSSKIFENGLTDTSGTVRLGGALTQDTVISSTLHDFNINGSNDTTTYAEDVIFGVTGGQEITNLKASTTRDVDLDIGRNLLIDSLNFKVGTASNSYTIGHQPDGTVALSIATTQYVDNAAAGVNTRKYNRATTLTVASQKAVLSTAPVTAFTDGAIYLNGVRQILTTDYTVTNTTTGEITFTAAQTLVAGDIVMMDFSDK